MPVRVGIDAAEFRRRIGQSPEQAGPVADTIRQTVANLAARGVRGVRAEVAAFHTCPDPIDCIPATGASDNEIDRFVAGRLFAALGEYGMFAQLFLGVGRDASNTAVPLPDPRTVTRLHGVFARYSCLFELVIGTAMNNLDAVQAARIFPNVQVGGMWWYNFRHSTYLESMGQRLEALPAEKSTLVVSDARCIEWAYGKILFIKTLLARFLHDRCRDGWLDLPEARRVAREWLHDAGARRYLPTA